MKIMLWIPTLDVGGAQRFAGIVSRAWHARGHEVTVATLDAGEAWVTFDEGIDVLRLDRMRSSGSPARALWNNLGTAAVIRRAVRHANPDVVVSLTDRMNTLVALAALGLGVPLVVSERTAPWLSDMSGGWRLLRRLAYRRATTVVVQTERAALWMRRVVPAPIYVMPNPVEPITPCARPMRREILAVGRLRYEKGFDILISAFGRLVTAHPDWGLRILGEGPDRALLQRQVDRLGLADRVDLPGASAEARDDIACAAVFALSSRWEGYPNALLEAMAASRCCVVTDCETGPAELIDDGVNGLLVPVEDAHELAVALDRVMSDPHLRLALGRSAGRVVQSHGLGPVLGEWDRLLTAAAAGTQ